MKTTKRLYNLLVQDKKDLFYLYAYAIFQGLINLSLPIGIQAIMGLVLAGRLSASWTVLTILVTIGVILAGVFQILQLYIVEFLQRKLFVRAAFEFAYRIPLFKTRAISGSYPPEMVHKFFDVVSVQKNLSKILMDFSASTLQILFGLILLSVYHPIFIAFGVVLLLLLFLILRLTYQRGFETSLKESNEKYRLAYWLSEIARNFATFKLLGNQDYLLKNTNEISDAYLENRKRHFSTLVTQYIGVISLKTIVTAGLLIIGALLLINNNITIGQFVASEIVIILVLNSSEKLINSMESVYDLLTSIEKLGRVTDIELDDLNEAGQVIEPNEPAHFAVKDLSIIGMETGAQIMKPVSFSSDAGKHIVVTGPSGSGKSSLLEVLSTKSNNYEGSISVDGIPLRNTNLESYRRQTGVLLSDQQIFNGSVLDNLTMYKQDADMREASEALEMVGLSKWVESLPNAYGEILTPSSKLLSQTARIRLLLARIVLAKPKYVFAEDVFSDLEPETCAELIDLLFKICDNTILIVVTNNPGIVKRANQIIKLK